MNSDARGLAWLMVAVAIPAALLLSAAPAAAKRDWAGKAVEVGPIWNQADAEVKCAKAARKSGGTWTGQWRTTRPGQMSVCEIKSGGGKGKGKTIEVGPIWNQADAEVKCRKAARQAGVRWTGQWWTTKPGRMSVCEIKSDRGVKLFWPEPTKGTSKPSWEDDRWGGTRWVEVGPIWNQIDAESKCPRAAGETAGRWTRQWKTTRPGQMSVCEIAR